MCDAIQIQTHTANVLEQLKILSIFCFICLFQTILRNLSCICILAKRLICSNSLYLGKYQYRMKKILMPFTKQAKTKLIVFEIYYEIFLEIWNEPTLGLYVMIFMDNFCEIEILIPHFLEQKEYPNSFLDVFLIKC